MKNVLDKKAILSAPDLPREAVEVPEWGGTVYIRGMTGTERDQWEIALLENKGQDGLFRARLVSLCAVDTDGSRLFDKADLAAISEKNAQALDRLFFVAARLSGLQSLEAAKGN